MCASRALSQEHTYLVWAFLAQNERHIDKSDYSQIASALVTDKDLHEVVFSAMHLQAFLVFTLQKFLKRPLVDR